MDLSLYKDEAQLDKTSPNKRKLSDESIDNDFDFDDDEDYEVSPKKKSKVKAKPESATKRARGAAKKQVVNDESTESDEENLMEIKKKAKRQVTSSTSKPIQQTFHFPVIFRLRSQLHQKQSLPRHQNQYLQPAKLHNLQQQVVVDVNALRNHQKSRYQKRLRKQLKKWKL